MTSSGRWVLTASSSSPTPKLKRQRPSRRSVVKDFLAKYKEAWETRDADLAANLFTRDARYKENPFGEPILGREAIHDYWKAATERQEDIHFAVSNFLHSGYILIAEWSCSYRDRSSGKQRELAGMFFADFYGSQVREFREYWQSRLL
jgi:ketosteroid isomerase-like protein